MNRLKYLDQKCALIIAGNFAGQSPSVAMLSQAGRITSGAHMVALRIGIRQLMGKSRRGPGYCLRMAQLTKLLQWVEGVAA